MNNTHHQGFDPHAHIDSPHLRISQSFKNAMVMQRRLMTKLLGDLDTHPAQAGCLRLLAREDGMSQSDLAERLQVSRPTVTTMLQKMEASGIIERHPDQRDQRITRIYLTADGRKLDRKLHAVFREIIQSSLGSFSGDEMAEFERLLGKLNENLTRALGDDAAPSGQTTEKEMRRR